MRLHHVNVVVPPGGTDVVVPFYELLGLTRLAKPTEGVALRSAGHPWSEKPPIGGAQRGMTADPQGNAVELVEAVGPFA